MMTPELLKFKSGCIYTHPYLRMNSSTDYSPITFQPIGRAELVFGETPVGTTCSYCQNKIITKTEYVDGTLTYLAASIICGLG